MKSNSRKVGSSSFATYIAAVIGLAAAAILWLSLKSVVPPLESPGATSHQHAEDALADASNEPSMALMPRPPIDTSGYLPAMKIAQKWGPLSSLEEVRECWDQVNERAIGHIDQQLSQTRSLDEVVSLTVTKATCYFSAGFPDKAYEALRDVRAKVDALGDSQVRSRWLSTLMFLQGVAGLRHGENENCIMCRGETSCILPISAAAVHVQEEGSRLAIQHFTEYLRHFPEDLEARWLLNIAHMTLGEHPDQVDPRQLISLDRFKDSEMQVGRFRDVGHLVGLNRFDQGGGSIMDDFDNDGLLDVFVTSWDANIAAGLYRNRGDGRFEDVSKVANLEGQLGGLVCVQADFNNDGLMDIYIPRGAWLTRPIRPSLLRNDGEFRFTDVTAEAGLLDPLNSNAAAWADFDNDGWIDLFVACEQQGCRLYRNLGNGTFQEMGEQAGVDASHLTMAKGCNWIDFDNDGFPDLFVSYLQAKSQLYRNNQDGTFTSVTHAMGIDGPFSGFACWAWDFDNDGWLDIFATCFERDLKSVVQGLIGEPHGLHSNRLYRNLEGKGFQDVTREAGLDMVFAAMGSNFGDFNNDGFLDMYLGTGEPNIETLVPNRMLMNVAGQRFVEVTASAGVGHLQKGHGVSSGDWDRNGSLDVFIQMGGAVDGDRAYNLLFQNPGNSNAWLTLKLAGTLTNRAAIGARIKITTAGANPLTIHRHVTSGSSFGGNPLEQTIGLGQSDRIAELEIHWPTSGTTQVFRDLAVNQAILVTELEKDFHTTQWKPIPLPNEEAPISRAPQADGDSTRATSTP